MIDLDPITKILTLWAAAAAFWLSLRRVQALERQAEVLDLLRRDLPKLLRSMEEHN
jgi:hypothetical protein